jgi:hypothetical protein
MIQPVNVTVEELTKAGKEHKWESCRCEGCQKRMWGHGYVLRYFSEVAGGLFLKRYRCSKCGAVVTTRPSGYWARVRSSTQKIYESLRTRLSLGPWLVPRQRGGHWLRRFIALAKMENKEDALSFLETCFLKKLSFFA